MGHMTLPGFGAGLLAARGARGRVRVALRAGLVVATAGLVAACAAPADEADPWHDQSRLALEEVAVLGGSAATGPSAFGTVRAVALLPESDELLVVDGQTQELHRFTLEGAHRSTLGGVGGGPGEHRALRGIAARRGGGFCTWDVQLVRVTRFDARGEVEAVARVDLDELDAIRPAFQGFFGDCGFVVLDEPSAMGMRDVPEGFRRDTLPLVWYGPDGAPAGPSVELEGPERWFLNRDRSWGYWTLIFGAERVGFTLGDELWTGVSDSLRWVRWDRSGNRLGRVVVPAPARPVSGSEVEAERRRRLEEAVEDLKRFERFDLGPGVLDAGRRSRERAIEVVPARDVLPAYDRVTPAAGVGVWVRRAPRPDDRETVWALIRADGSLRGVIELARSEAIVAAAESVLVVLGRDELDAPVLRVLRAVEGGGG